MEWIQKYQGLNQKEREEFARIINRLLTSTFLVKHQETARRDFYFVERHQALVVGYLKLINWELVVDKPHGVVQVINREGGSRLQLRLIESVILLLLRLIYEEKRRELNIADQISCLVQEVHDKAYSLRVREKSVVEKKHLRDAFATFRRFSLIEPLDDDITDPNCRILLYPTLLFAVRMEGLQELHDRLQTYTEGGEPTEATDGDQTN